MVKIICGKFPVEKKRIAKGNQAKHPQEYAADSGINDSASRNLHVPV